MVFDHLDHAELYFGLSTRLKLALSALRTDLPTREEGRYDLAGDDVFAMVQSYQTQPPSACVWEAHRKYIDVQYLVSGEEAMGCVPIESMTESQPYNAEKDFALYTGVEPGKSDIVIVKSGMFAIFFPTDVHMPKLAPHGVVGIIKKVVVKVAVG